MAAVEAKFCTSSSRPTASARTDSDKDTPPTPDPPAGDSDYSAQRDNGLPNPSRMALPDDYEHDNRDNEKEDKVAPSTLHPRLIFLPARHILVPRGIKTNPSLPKRRFLTTMNATMKTTTKTKIRGGGNLGYRVWITKNTT